MNINSTLKIVCALFLFFLTASINSQNYFQGILLDAETLSPIDNVNVFYGNSGIGTVSNSEGLFELIIPEGIPREKLNFRHLSYEQLSLDNIVEETIYLVPSVFELEEVVIGDFLKVQKDLLGSFEKNTSKISSNEKFFYKESLKENDQYVNYVEALGVCSINPKGNREVYIRGKRQTEDKSIGFVKFSSNIHNLFKKVDLVRKSEVLKRVLINESTYKITLKSLENNNIYEVYAEKSSYNILRITSNTINNQMELIASSQRGYYAGKFVNVNVYQQGSSTDIDFKMVKGKRYINKIVYKVKLCMQTKDQSLKRTYSWDRFYLNTGFFDGFVNFEAYTRLTERSNFFDEKIVNNILDWSAENKILPIENELEILNVLNW
tara:strand:+ start:187 stop:1323 length:1137 start_codon:yes stop_codon:yes gene_type:complete